MHRPGCSTNSLVLILTTMAVLDHLPAVIAAAQCFGVDGQKSAGAPCKRDVTGSGTSHSACCDESKQEACLSSGLCFATMRSDNTTFWAEGCTDPTGRDPTCPSYCGTMSQFIPMPPQPSYTMLFCGETRWCCCFDNLGKTCDKTECCSRNFTLTQGLGTVLHQFDNAMGSDPRASNSNNENDTNCRLRGGGGANCDGDGLNGNMRLIPLAVAGILGSLLLAMTVAFGFSCTQNRRLRRQVDTLQNINTDLKTSAASSTGTISARPSVTSIQPLVQFKHPSWRQQDEQPAAPSPDSYNPNSSSTIRTANSLYQANNNISHHHQSMAPPVTPHEPTTPSSIGPPPPGYGFPGSGPSYPPMPPQLSGRRPSLPEMQQYAIAETQQYSMPVPPPPLPQEQHPVPRRVITELPTEKDHR